MTDIVDLIDSPAERLDHIFVEFVKRLEERHEREEEMLDLTIERSRTKLANLHRKSVSVYKNLYQSMLDALQHDIDVPIVQFFEKFLKTEKSAMFSDVCERALPVIKEIEERGGRLAVHIEKEGYGPSGCIYSPGRNDYFDFFDDFFEDEDDYEYKLVRRRVDKEQHKKEEAERDRKFWIRQRRRDGPKNEQILKEFASSPLIQSLHLPAQLQEAPSKSLPVESTPCQVPESESGDLPSQTPLPLGQEPPLAP